VFQETHRCRQVVGGPNRGPHVPNVAGKFLGPIEQPRRYTHPTGIPVDGQAPNFRFVVAAPVKANAAQGFTIPLGNPEVAAGPFQVTTMNVSQIMSDGSVQKFPETLPIIVGVQVTFGEIFLPVEEQLPGYVAVFGEELTDRYHAHAAREDRGCGLQVLIVL
jgi:hypothetical protein